MNRRHDPDLLSIAQLNPAIHPLQVDRNKNLSIPVPQTRKLLVKEVEQASHAHAASGRATFRYQFRAAPASPRQSVGAFHAAEIGPLFDRIGVNTWREWAWTGYVAAHAGEAPDDQLLELIREAEWGRPGFNILRQLLFEHKRHRIGGGFCV